MKSDFARYDGIGSGYALFRREDPLLGQRIHAALGAAQSVVNVGAGSGSYEPIDRVGLAIEPSELMIRQRGERSWPVVRAKAEDLPLHDKSFDAAMAILTLHHWHPLQEQGVREMLRVARERVIIVTIDPRVSGRMWLMADYFPEVARLDHEIFPIPEQICEWLGGGAQCEEIPVSRESPDWSLLSYWAHPERVLDAAARAATSGFARQPPEVTERIVEAVRRDLASGVWDARYGHLRQERSLDAGLRLCVSSFLGN